MVIGLADIPRFPPDALEILPKVAPYLTALMIRGKGVSPRELLELGRAVRAVVPDLALVVNDRFEVALALGAEGLHLPADALEAETMRGLWPRRLSVSVHTRTEAERHLGADFYLWGNVFETASKPGAPPRDRTALDEVAELVKAPILAVGGVRSQNVDTLPAMGFSGAVASDGIWRAKDPAEAARRIAAAFLGGRGAKEVLWN